MSSRRVAAVVVDGEALLARCDRAARAAGVAQGTRRSSPPLPWALPKRARLALRARGVQAPMGWRAAWEATVRSGRKCLPSGVAAAGGVLLALPGAAVAVAEYSAPVQWAAPAICRAEHQELWLVLRDKALVALVERLASL